MLGFFFYLEVSSANRGVIVFLILFLVSYTLLIILRIIQGTVLSLNFSIISILYHYIISSPIMSNLQHLVSSSISHIDLPDLVYL